MSYCILVDEPDEIDWESGDGIEVTHITKFYELSDTGIEAALNAASYLNYTAQDNRSPGDINETYYVNGPCGSCQLDCPGRAHQPQSTIPAASEAS